MIHNLPQYLTHLSTQSTSKILGMVQYHKSFPDSTTTPKSRANAVTKTVITNKWLIQLELHEN
jgi:hypothetical protein